MNRYEIVHALRELERQDHHEVQQERWYRTEELLERLRKLESEEALRKLVELSEDLGLYD